MNNEKVQVVIQAVDEASAVLKRVSSSLDGAKKAFDSLGEASISTGKSIISGLQSGFGFLVDKVKEVSLLVGGAAVGITAFGIKSAADLQQTSIAFEVMLGSADKAKTLMGQLSKMAKSTPFEFPELADTAKLLLSYGIQQKDIISNTRMLGDLSMGEAAKLKTLALAYGQIASKGKLAGQEVLQLTSAGIPVVGKLAEKFKVTREQMDDMISRGQIGFKDVQDILTGMTQKGGPFFGMMDRQSKSFNGLISTAKDTFGQFARNIVGLDDEGVAKPGGLFDRLNGYLSQLMSDENQARFTQLGAAIGDFFINVIEKYGSRAAEVLSGIGDVVQGVIHWFSTWEVANDTLWNGLVKLFGPQMAGPIMAFLIDLNIQIQDLIPKVKDFAAQSWDKIQGFFDYLKQNSDAVVAALIAVSVAIIASMVPALYAAAAPIISMTLLIGGIAAAAFFLYKIWNENWGGIRETLTTVWNIIKPHLDELWSKIQNDLAPAIQKFSVETWPKIVDAFEKAKPTLESVGKIIGGLIVLAIIQAIDYTTKLVDGFTQLVNFFTNNMDKIKKFNDLLQSLAGNMNPLQTYSKVFDFMQGKAQGGSVFGGTSYLVGEKGPEIFTPNTSGTITPNDKVSTTSNMTFNNYFNQNYDVNSIASQLAFQIRTS